MNKKIILSVLILFLIGGTAAYAGQVIKTYKTVRGTTATIEAEEVHKGRIGLTVNGAKVNKPTWYAGATTYVPLRDVAEMLGATVNYNSNTQSADIVAKAGGSSQKDLETLKVYSDLSYSLMGTEAITDLFFAYQTIFPLAIGEIEANSTREELDYIIEQFDTMIEVYNGQVDVSNASLDSAQALGVLKQEDVDLFVDAMEQLSLALDELELAIIEIDKYYYGEVTDYEQAFVHLNNSLDYQKAADDLIFEGLTNYHTLTQNYNSATISAAGKNHAQAPSFHKREKYNSVR
ncbi:hypothetical protein J7I80_05645 [Bacillus sp. ISL-41]|uniref:stalk domain-containing protein n=1 Tax=Bacillus sp. ISL-41 TaxID=2819127 RepID=UPI001BEB15E1|nr:stalk domain-containing protein [Bacillus sp. ISL-41]MBT2641698.1 hypothetical protein [Bacillus sp. ISL-41]